MTVVEPVLEGPRVRLAPFTMTHAADPAYLGWLRDVDVVRTLNLPRYVAQEVSDAEIAEYCRGQIASASVRFFALVLRDDARFVGTVKVAAIDAYAGTADMGIMIGDRTVWGRGLASEALGVLGAYLFGEMGLRRLTAGSMASNPAMVRVFEKLGFRIEGIARQQDRLGDDYIDHIHLGCLRDEFRGPAWDKGKTEER